MYTYVHTNEADPDAADEAPEQRRRKKKAAKTSRKVQVH